MTDGTAREEEGGEASRLRVQLKQAQFELELSRQNAGRLADEVRVLEHRLAQAETDCAAVQNLLLERDAYVESIFRSTGWRLLQWVRHLLGRRW